MAALGERLQAAWATGDPLALHREVEQLAAEGHSQQALEDALEALLLAVREAATTRKKSSTACGTGSPAGAIRPGTSRACQARKTGRGPILQAKAQTGKQRWKAKVPGTVKTSCLYGAWHLFRARVA
jgi:hypothetical protein